MELKPTFSVSELNEYVQLTLSHDPNLSNLSVQGEISGFHRHSSGHLYFTLKDDKASVKCVMFKMNALRLRFVPKDGAQVKIAGQASLYQRDGSFQVYVNSMEALGTGALYQQFLEMKERLNKQGYFDESNKKAIPKLPLCIGIVTSKTGAVLRDIHNVLNRRFPAMGTKLYPTAVQGAGAANEIARAIETANYEDACDVLIVARGGGSMEDLWAFNELPVADAIFKSHIPIISAVGHETDFSISDFVADLRAPTPSAAAELAVPEYEQLEKRLSDSLDRLNHALQNGILRKRDKLDLLIRRPAFVSLPTKLMQQRQGLDENCDRLIRLSTDDMTRRNNSLTQMQLKLDANSPNATLRRGFALVTDRGGALVTSAEQIIENEELTIHFSDGNAAVKVQERNKQ
ncbi:MAG: exodeoxyribonuclease VII large subunit [Eubacteriales bacterium]|nr:exodeoxyribonuclease VII large subunit [Eubacteriales bacterium]